MNIQYIRFFASNILEMMTQYFDNTVAAGWSVLVNHLLLFVLLKILIHGIEIANKSY